MRLNIVKTLKKIKKKYKNYKMNWKKLKIVIINKLSKNITFILFH